MPGACCSSPPPTRPAIWRLSGGRLSGSGSRSRPRHRRIGRLAGSQRGRRVPSPAGSLGGVPGVGPGGAKRGPPGPRGGDRSGDRPGSPGVAPGAGGVHARRGRCRRARAVRSSSAGAGGFAAAAAFLERSSALTPEAGRRAGRALAAAQAKQEAGALDEALTLVTNAEAARSTSSSGPRSTSFAPESPSPRIGEVRHHACCSRPPEDSRPSMCGRLVRSTSTR